MALFPEFSGLKAWIRAHPIIALPVWFFPVARAIALVPVVIERPFGVEVPQNVFNSAPRWSAGSCPSL